MKVLIIDIETSPIVADVWGLWQQNVGLNQIHFPTQMISFAAKWKGEKRTSFFADWTVGHEEMVAAAWMLLEEADVVVHYNGDSFDVKHLNREFREQGFTPPAPFKSVDVLKSVKARFRLPSNKLQYVSEWLGLDGKVQHSGHSLWTGVMAGDAKSQKLMEKYNKHDVVLLEQVYDELGSWLVNAPNINLYDDLDGCPKCGSVDLQKRGFSYTATGAYQRFVCNSCGQWSTDGTREKSTKKKAVR